MTGIPSSTIAIENGEFETLEERIFQTNRDPEEEFRISVRMEVWQRSAVENIAETTGASKADVLNALYAEGLETIREEIGWERMSELFTMRFVLHQISSVTYVDEGSVKRVHQQTQQAKLDVDTDPQGNEKKVVNVPVRDSIVSEVKDNFIDRMHIPDADFHRSLIVFGFLSSDTMKGIYMEYASDMLEDMKRAYGESREIIERTFRGFLSYSLPEWSDGEHHPDYEDIAAYIERMETRHKEPCKRMMESELSPW